MSETTHGEMEHIEEGQVAADVVYNTNLEWLGWFFDGAIVVDRDLTAPPGSPADHAVYIPAATASGDWATHENELAKWSGSAWEFKVEAEGRVLFIDDENVHVYWNGSAYTDLDT